MKYIIHSNYGTTGGHQSLHQICSTLNDIGQDSYMMYPPVGHDCVVKQWNEIYGINKFIHREENIDEPDHIHVT